MSKRWLFAVALIAVAAPPVAAKPHPKKDKPRVPPDGETPDSDADAPSPTDKGEKARATSINAFQHDLDSVFTADGLTAEAAAHRAAKVAPQVAHKAAAIEAAAADVAKSKLSLVPILQGTAQYTRLSALPSVVIPLGPENFVIPFLVNSYDANAKIALNLSDYLLHDGPLIEAANLAADSARFDRTATAETSGEQARETYYEWLRAKLQVLVAKRSLAQVETTLAQVKTLVDVQRASTADLLRVQSQRAQARQVIDQLENAVSLREEQLRLLIDAGDNEQLTIGEDIRAEVKPPQTGEFAALASQAADHRLELKTVDAGIAAKEAARKAERSSLAPKLTAFASVDYGDPSFRVFPEVDQFKLTWLAGAQLSWVFNETLAGAQTRNKLDAEAAELRADRVDLSHQIRLQVLAAYQGVGVAFRAIETTKEGVDAAEESYRVRKDLFAAGRASVIEMVDVETELTRARIAALDARIDLRIALGKLAYATGAAAATTPR